MIGRPLGTVDCIRCWFGGFVGVKDNDETCSACLLGCNTARLQVKSVRPGAKHWVLHVLRDKSSFGCEPGGLGRAHLELLSRVEVGHALSTADNTDLRFGSVGRFEHALSL